MSLTNLKLHEFPEQSFIQGAYIPEYVCDNLIDYFENNKEKQIEGFVYSSGEAKVKHETKKSTDMTFNPSSVLKDVNVLSEYINYLSLCIKEYEHKYDEVKMLSKYGISEGCSIQKYLPGEGFYTWHFERGEVDTSTRCLVFMTYLNDVPEGGTDFKYQKLTSPAKKGLTLIWPSDWTHTHRGQVSDKYTKYIITGWLNYKD